MEDILNVFIFDDEEQNDDIEDAAILDIFRDGNLGSRAALYGLFNFENLQVFAQMETDTVSSQRIKWPVLLLPQLKMDPHEENSSGTILWSKGEKVVDLPLKYNGEENSINHEFVEFASIEKFESEKDKLDQKEFDLCLEESSYIKWENRALKKIKVEPNDRDIEKTFDNCVMEPCAIKKETDDVKNVAAGELFKNDNPFKSESIEQEELHVKYEENIKDSFGNKIPQPGERAVLHQCSEYSCNTSHKNSIRHNDWYRCPESPCKHCQRSKLKTKTKVQNEALRPGNPKKHLKEHKTSVLWLHCSKCSFKARFLPALRNHVLAHKSDTFKCSRCPYHSRTKRQLTIHQLKHESMDKWHSCSLCPFKTYDKNTLRKHCLRRHSTDPNCSHKQTEIFKCTKCFYENRYEINFKRHQLTHDRSSWFQCPECAYKTTCKSRLKKHLMQHQGENAEDWLRCLECSYKTVHKQGLQRHIMTHKTADEIQWLQCSQCSFKTAYKSDLRRHQLMHKEGQEIEWFYCYECSFKTKHKHSLARHVLKHKKTMWQR